MPPIFKTDDGLPLACFVDPSSKGKAALLRTIRASRSNGGGIGAQDTDADIILIDAEIRESRQRARDMCRSSIVLFNEWVDACVSAGRLLGADHKWGSLRIEDPAMVDESLYTDEDPQQSIQHAPRVPEEEEDVNYIHLVPVVISSTPLSSRATRVVWSSFTIKIQSTAGSFVPTPDANAPPSSKRTSIPPNSTESPSTPPFGQVPKDPQFAALFISAHEQWQKLKEGTEFSVIVTQTPNSTVVPHQRDSSHDPLDIIATPERIYEPLARRPRPSHEVSSGSSERGSKRRKFSNGSQRGIRSKVPSVLVPAPGAVIYSRSADEHTKTTTSEPGTAPASASASAPPTPNTAYKQVFNDLGVPTQFWLQVDLPDRGSIVRLIKRHGGQIASTVEAATYVIVSKTTPQYTEVLAVAQAAGRVAVPIAWIHESIRINRMAAVDDYSLSISDSELGSLQPTAGAGRLTKEDFIAVALSPQPPAPPTNPPSLTYNSRIMFTAEDRNYLQCLLAWRLYRDSSYSITALCRELHEKLCAHIYNDIPNYLAARDVNYRKALLPTPPRIDAMLQRSFRAYGLILTAALTLLFLSAGFQQRLSLDDLLWASPARPEINRKTADSQYRQQLSTVREIDRLPHSRTLGIAQKIYVIGLARRVDRRAHMAKLMAAMDLDFEYYDALDLHDDLVTTILERVRWARAQSRIGHEHEVTNPQGLKFEWLPDVGSSAPVPPRAGVDYWFVRSGDPQGLKPLPPPPSPDTRPPLLRTAGEDELLSGEVITRAQVSCWYSHYEVLLKIARGEDEVAIILEDDIDMEWDLERRLRQMWPHLPKDWDVVMLGHCFSDENSKPPVHGTPHLHPSTHVLCTHAYAVSRTGARRMIRYLRTPLFAFSRPIDHAFQHFNWHKILNVYSIEPAVVIQTKDTLSDIVSGTGGEQDEWLADSAMARVAYYEKLKLARVES
ncbi:hypothetical protein FRC06_002658 [Ceratobasidium sp. 370]|nr:hypothetical protein FRC06_002658 [Ceratobasidium sp. 370]